MNAINGWPGKPFVPLHPEKDGWHWMKTPDNEVMPFEWRAEGECERGHWPSYWVSQGEDCWTAEECEYIGPVLTPDEATALQKRIAELEAQNDMLRHATDKLRAMLAELNARHEPLQRAFITAVELLNDAALKGGKDE